MRAADEALIVIDVQNDFCPNGALAVAEGDAIIPQINALMPDFACVVLTKTGIRPITALLPICMRGLRPLA